MQLTILSTSDTHGFIEPTNYVKRDQDLPFSLSKAATIIQQIRKNATGPVLTIENGDYLQGSPLAYYVARVHEPQQPELLTQAYNQIGYDVGTIGNHEFNYGADYLRQAIKTLNYPVLSGNIFENDQPAFGPQFQIIVKNGIRIGVIGVTTQYIQHWETPSHIVGLQFESAVAALKRLVPQVRAQVDVVVVAYHGGFERDLATGEPTEKLTGENEGYAILQQVPGIDALVTGHQHRAIATTCLGVPTTQPGYRGEFVGQITLDLERDATGKIQVKAANNETKLIATGAAQADPSVQKIMAPIANATETWLDQPLGHVHGDMRITDPNAARLNESAYIEFIQKVQLAATGAKISGTALFNNEGRGFGNIITMRDVVTNYIYPNTLAVLKVSGAELKAALEQTAEYFQLTATGGIGVTPRFVTPKPQHYNYDMYQGIDYTIDVSRPVSQRITQFNFEGQPIQMDQSLEIVINQYRAVGGGNYGMFGADKIVRENQKDMTELIADYLQSNPELEATIDHNFHVINGAK